MAKKTTPKKRLARKEARLLVKTANADEELCVNLDHIRGFEKGAAKELGKLHVDGIEINLNGLKLISNEDAVELSKITAFEGSLELKGLKTISEKAAGALDVLRWETVSGDEFMLELVVGKKIRDKIHENVSPQLANSLVQRYTETGEPYKYDLSAYKGINTEAALCFSNYDGIVALNGLKVLPDEIAEILSNTKMERLELNGLKTISEKAANYLAKFSGSIVAKPAIRKKIEASKAST